jgi:hypothetical protein
MFPMCATCPETHPLLLYYLNYIWHEVPYAIFSFLLLPPISPIQIFSSAVSHPAS